MARIRTIKPEFWTDGEVMDLSPFARLLFIGSWNFAMCDFGHLADDPRRLKMQVLPSDDVDADALVAELIGAGRMVRIHADGRTFLHIKRFTDHQKTEKRWTPRCPACVATSPNPAEPLPTSPNLSETPRTSAPDRKGEEGKGKDLLPRKRATALPDDFTPSDKHLALAAELGIDLRSEWPQFCDHHRSRGTTMKDWDAALRTWIRNAQKFGRSGKVVPIRPGPDGHPILPPPQTKDWV